MMKQFRFFLLAFFTLFVLHSQEGPTYDAYWKLLFENRREEAVKKFDKKRKKDIEDILVHQLLRGEQGKFDNPDDFIQKVVQSPDFDYYLYALWNHNFFFDTYYSTGFNQKILSNIDAIELDQIGQPTVREAMRYLKSAAAQHRNNWESYYRLNEALPAIKAWQFCGSFENLNGSGLATEYGPENKAFSETDFNANSNGFVNWYTPEGREKEAYQYYSNHSEYGGAVNYAQTFIDNPVARRAVIRLGSSALIKVWLNDVLLFENTNDGITGLDAYNIAVDLPQGTNRLLVKSADQTGMAYFIVRITDGDGEALSDLTYGSAHAPYAKSTATSLSPEVITHPVEAFFLKKMEREPNNFFNVLCLANTYLRNSKYTEAKALLSPLLEAYPKSSFLRKYLIECYSKEKDYTTVSELSENIQNDDKDYYLSYVYRFQGASELFKLPLADFEEFMKAFSEATDMPILQRSAELMLALRHEDQDAVRAGLKAIVEENKDQLNVLKIYLNLYADYLNEDDRAIGILEEINDHYFDYSALKSLAAFYNKQNRKDEALQLFEERYDRMRTDNIFLSDFIGYLHQYGKYGESLPYIDQMLANFPYSFVGMELKATALEQMGKKKEALEWYAKSLKHNGANTAMRKKIDDLSKAKDYFEELATPDIYGFIAENRDKAIANNYGYNYLLDETLLQLYPEGGGKSRARYVVEITSDSGIESLKEIDLGLSGNYSITKSEIVKPNNQVVPASKNGSSLVFNNLEIGDVLYVDYESSYANSGRFYKDHVDYFQFGSYHPIVKNSLKVLVPKGKEFRYKVVNGAIPYEKRTLGDYVYHKWETVDQKALPQPENYMPSLSDIASYVHLSTIASWDDIANWYADLVRPQMVVNSDVEAAFKKIFPEGTASLGDDQKASRIYYYIMENFSYSHVSFRQSGYVPQKPSKTIKSKLGDCKDFSTLYVTLAQMAGLKSHLVLVLTSDYGEKSILLPSQDFNHCIAKVFIDGQPQYLELTDNNLPYKAAPTSLENATALDIPNNKVKQVASGIYRLDNFAHTLTVLESNMVFEIGTEQHRLQIESVLRGSINSHYAGIFKEKNYDVVKKSISDDFQGRITEDFVLDSLHSINYDLRSPVLSYVSEMTVNEKLNEIGSLKVFSIPAVNNAYNTTIIEGDKREYPIDYLFYENADEYRSHYIIKLEEGDSFAEVPENVSYSFKKHRFDMSFDLVRQNELHIEIGAQTPKDRIAPSDYKDFKTYVKSVLDAKKQLIGFKKGKSVASGKG